MRKLTLQDAILGSANYAIISTTAAGVVTMFNATAERWLGYTAAEIVGKVTPALWHDADEVVARAKVLSRELGRTIEPGFDVFAALSRLGQADDQEWTFIRKDGSRFPVSLSITSLADEAGEIFGFLGVIADITERIKTEAALRESEERMRLATEVAGVAVWAWDVRSGAIHWDEQMFAIYGIPPKPGGWVTYADWSSRVLPADLAEQEEKLQRTVATCGRSEREFRITRASDNTVRFIQAIETVSLGTNGNANRVVGINLDITERKRVSAVLQESKRFLQSTLDALSSHIAILDEHGTIIEVNAAWNRFASENTFMGSHRGAGDNYLQLCDSASGRFSEEAPVVAAGIRAVMAGRSDEFHLEYPCHSPKEHRWFIVRATRFGGDGIIRVVIAHENITARKKLEVEREKLITELQAALAEVKTLSGLIPICAWCKNVRTDQGFWQTVEQYVRSNSEATFSHGMCPDCAKKFKADILKGNPTQPA